jgi:hypothetical protein
VVLDWPEFRLQYLNILGSPEIGRFWKVTVIYARLYSNLSSGSIIGVGSDGIFDICYYSYVT